MRSGKFGFRLGVLSLLAIAGGTVSAAPKDKDQGRPLLFQKLIDCRAIADAPARLACYDAQVAQLDEAEAKNQVVVVDKEQVKKARQGLFGFSLPNLGKLFGGGDGENGVDEVNQIEAKIASARDIGSGTYVFTLEDGARWQQMDGILALPPKAGQTIRIKKAALGSFIANVNKQPGIKVKRIN